MSFSNKLSSIQILKAGSTVLVALGISLALEVAYYSYTKQSYSPPENIFPKPEPAEKYEIVALGNSHTGSGITFDGYTIKGKNLGAVAQRFTYDLAVLKHHRAEIAPNAIVLINASPISFSHTKTPHEASFQNGYYNSVSPIYIPNLMIGNYIEAIFLSFTKSGYHWRQLVTDQLTSKLSAEEKARFEELRTKTVELPSPDVPNTTPTTATTNIVAPLSQPEASADAALVSDYSGSPLYIPTIERQLASPSAQPNRLGESVIFMYNKWYHTDEFDPQYFDENRADLEAIIRYAKEQGWRPVVITIPISAELQEGLLDDYMQTYLYDNIAKTDLQGTEYIDFSTHPGLTQNTEWFANSDHLNDKGAIAFSYVLLETLIEKGYLPEDASGYIPAPVIE